MHDCLAFSSIETDFQRRGVSVKRISIIVIINNGRKLIRYTIAESIAFNSHGLNPIREVFFYDIGVPFHDILPAVVFLYPKFGVRYRVTHGRLTVKIAPLGVLQFL